jgi:hypothetical protein
MRAKDSCDQHGAVGAAAIIGGVGDARQAFDVGDARQAFEALHGGALIEAMMIEE